MASIESFKNVGSTTYRVVWRNAEGIRQRSPTFDDHQEAVRYKSILEGDQARGIYYDPAAPRTRFGTYAEAWLDTRALVGRRDSEASFLSSRILPQWGHYELGAIKRSMVQEWINALARDIQDEEWVDVADGAKPRPAHLMPAATSSIISYFSTFSMIMKHAALDGCLPMGTPCPPR